MGVRNALDIKKGGVLKQWEQNVFTQPLQFLTMDKKDEEWFEHNADWIEWQGLKQVRAEGPRILKNYNLARGIIEKADYIPEENPELEDVLDAMITEGEDLDSAFDLKFFPIIPVIINVLTAEFAKRNTKIGFRAVDEYSANEIIQAKTAEIEAALIEDAQQKLMEQMLAMGMDPNSPEAQQQFDPEAIKKLPQIDNFYKKDYRTTGEIWAGRQHKIDVERFKMDEMEETAFYDSLAADRAFFHFQMFEDDYGVEVLNTALTFFHKSPKQKYISGGSYAGFFEPLTVSDAIDLHGWKMTDEQMRSLERMLPTTSTRFLDGGIGNDGSQWDPTQSVDDNRSASAAMKKYLAHKDMEIDACDPVSYIIGQKPSGEPLVNNEMLRACTLYWKGQRLLYHLTSIGEGGEVVTDIVDEHYKVVNNPIYNNKFDSRKNNETLVYGDHLEPLWQNIVYGTVKLSHTSMSPMSNLASVSGESPIYLGVDGPKPGPLKFQFKGDSSIYGAKLPIEGRVFSEHNTRSHGLVDMTKPSQIGFNMCMNQIMDIMIDEAGTVVVIDQNALPQHSLDETWGKNNVIKAYETMRDLSILPLDTTLANTEAATNFSHYQTLDLEQSKRLMSRIQLARFFKEQALEVIGITPQRLGQQLGQIDSAKGVEMSVTGSFAQTEMYFINFCDHLMPRVHQMRTDLAQFYHSKKSSMRLRSSLTDDERTWFELNGIDLLLLDINVFATTNANMRVILEEMKNFIKTNNTSGATPFDVGKILQTDTVAHMNTVLKELDQKAQQNAQAAQEAEKEKWQAELKAKKEEKQMAFDHERQENEKKNRKDVIVAEIKAAGYGAMQDMNENKQSDFADEMDKLRATEEYNDTMNFNRQKHSDGQNIAQRKLDIEQQRIDLARETSQIPLQIARENRSASEINADKKKNSKN